VGSSNVEPSWRGPEERGGWWIGGEKEGRLVRMPKNTLTGNASPRGGQGGGGDPGGAGSPVFRREGSGFFVDELAAGGGGGLRKDAEGSLGRGLGRNVRCRWLGLA